MPTLHPGDDEPEEEDFEGTEPEYHPEADEAGELWCPKCGAVMHADADRCPSCGDYVTPGLAPARPWPLWLRLGLGFLVLAVAAACIAGLAGR